MKRRLIRRSLHGKIQQVLDQNSFRRYHNIPTTLSVLEAYRRTVGATPNAQGQGSGCQIATVNGVGCYVVVCEGKFIAPKSGNYTFYAAPDEYALFYLSEKPLKYNPDADKAYLLLRDESGYHGSYDTNKGSEWRMLQANKEYYFSFVIYNTDGAGGGKMGYRINSTGSVVDIPASNVINVDANMEDVRKSKWEPNWEEIEGIDTYSLNKKISPRITGVTAPKEQLPRDVSNLINGNTNDIYVSKFNPPKDAEPFPHEYSLTFAEPSPVESVKLTSCKGMQPPRNMQTSNLSILCDGRLVGTTAYESLSQSDISLSGMTYCSEVTVHVSDNAEKWDDVAGGSCFREITIQFPFSASKIIPVTNQFLKFTGNCRDVTTGGYYNGVGKYISKGGSVELEFSGGQTEFVLLGDRWQNEAMTDIASVYVNGNKIGEFTPDLKTAPAYGSKQYLSPIFVAKGLQASERTRIRVTVESGEIGLAGLLILQSEDHELVHITSNSQVLSLSNASSPIDISSSTRNSGAAFGITITVSLVTFGVVSGAIILLAALRNA